MHVVISTEGGPKVKLSGGPPVNKCENVVKKYVGSRGTGQFSTLIGYANTIKKVCNYISEKKRFEYYKQGKHKKYYSEKKKKKVSKHGLKLLYNEEAIFCTSTKISQLGTDQCNTPIKYASTRTRNYTILALEKQD